MLPVEEKENLTTLKEAQELFERWRKDKKFRDPIPPSLWEAALSLADDHSVYTIAKRLRVNYANLKARVEARPVGGRNEGGPAFVEIASLGTTIEITRPTGERMTITGSCDAAELARIFLG